MIKKILIAGVVACVAFVGYCLLYNPTKGDKPHKHNPCGLQSDSSQVYLLHSSQEYLDSLILHISEARESIYMEMYDLGGDQARKVVDLMRRKAREGVKVEVLVDGWGTKDEPWNYDAIRADGVDIQFWDEVKFPVANHVLHRNHRKVVIIDGEWTFIGSTNIADYSFGHFQEHPDSFPCYDMNIQMRAGAPQVSIVEKAEDLMSTMNALIAGARDSIRIIQPYIALPAQIQDALLDALSRGVDVQFLMGEWTDLPVYQQSAFGLFHRVLGPAGARIWLCKDGFHHTKALSVDGKVLFLGSTNMTLRALRRNLEENILIQDSRLVSAFDAYFSDFVARSIPFDDNYWERMPADKRRRSTLAHRLNWLIVE